MTGRSALLAATNSKPSYIFNDSDAESWAELVQSADQGQVLENDVYAAVDTYVQNLKAAGIWSLAAQLLLLCGPRTLQGALIPLKGVAPTNVNFVSANYARKNGLGAASNTSKYLNSNVDNNSLPQTSQAIFGYGSFSGTSAKYVGGWYGNGNNIIALDEWNTFSTNGRTYRCGSVSADALIPTITSTAPVTCMIGTRTSSTSAAIYCDSLSATSSGNMPAFTQSNLPLYYFAINQNGGPALFTSSIVKALGIFSTGLNASQAASLRSATASYVAALAASIP
jgi:hypothetical protein